MKKRTVIFSYKSNTENPDKYIFYLLNSFKKISNKIIVVVDDDCPESCISELKETADRVIVSEKRNLAGKYLKGTTAVDTDCDELILSDDSFFGPLYSFESVFAKAENELGDADFWGICGNSTDLQDISGCGFDILPYFLVIRKRLLSSDDLLTFINANADVNSSDLTNRFSRHFSDIGYKAGVMFRLNDESTTLELLKKGLPILKLSVAESDYINSLAEKKQSEVPQILDFINSTDYDADIILDRIIKRNDPFEVLSILNNYFIVPENSPESNADRTAQAAVLIDVSGNECTDKIGSIISSISDSIRTFVITGNESENTNAKRSFCSSELFSRTDSGFGEKLISALSEYKYLCFMDLSVPLSSENSYTDDHIEVVAENLFGAKGYRENILGIFERTSRLGLLMPMPEIYGDLYGGQALCSEKVYDQFMTDILSGNEFSDAYRSGHITAFWCRTDALLPTARIFIEKTGSFVCENAYGIVQYAAKSSGYCSGYISTPESAAINMNNYVYSHNRTLLCLNELESSVNNSLKAYEIKLKGKFSEVRKLNDIDNLENRLKTIRSNAGVIRRSRFFDKKWYMQQYPECADYKYPPEYHYLNIGWKKGYDPSLRFSTQTYLQLNTDVKKSGMCPLVHFERFGKRERRPYITENGSIVRAKGNIIPAKAIASKLKSFLRHIRYYFKYRHINENKIVFRTFQNDYTCNPKYICEELLREKLPYEIVWITDSSGKNNKHFPSGVRLVKAGTGEALREIMTSRIMIDNGILPLRSKLFKKKDQISINTWHGSMGFKRLDGNQLKKAGKTAALYSQINDYVISNSTFEDNVFRTSYWKKNEFLKCGHPRNDILMSDDKERLSLIKHKVYSAYNIPEDRKLVLYAPTFREKLTEGSVGGEAEKLDLDMLCDALEKKFGGEWGILSRAHFVNAKMSSTVSASRHRIYNATDYPDIQELMVAADVGLTDYSSWILDYMLSRKPAFLFTSDYDDYSFQRGFYYPLSESPFPIGRNNRELSEAVEEFDDECYRQKIEDFLVGKGSREDGCGSIAVVELIKKLMSSKDQK